MSDEAEVTMMVYTGLLPDEETRLKAMEPSIQQALFENFITARPVWMSSGTLETRVVQLVIPDKSGGKSLLELAPKDVVNISDDKLKSILIQGLAQR